MFGVMLGANLERLQPCYSSLFPAESLDHILICGFKSSHGGNRLKSAKSGGGGAELLHLEGRKRHRTRGEASKIVSLCGLGVQQEEC